MRLARVEHRDCGRQHDEALAAVDEQTLLIHAAARLVALERDRLEQRPRVWPIAEVLKPRRWSSGVKIST